MEDSEKKAILDLARKSIESNFKHHTPEMSKYRNEFYESKKGAFVTLHKHKDLRGCIGYIVGFKPLSETIVEMARAAAFRDPRFPPVRENELKEIDIEVSILSELIRVETAEDIVVGRDGLLIEHPYGSGVLLPQVPIEWGWDRHTYLVHLCRKAGLSDDAWTEQESKLYRFTAEVFSEREFE